MMIYKSNSVRYQRIVGYSITESAKVLNLDTAEFTNTLNSFVVDIGRISLEGMTFCKTD